MLREGREASKIVGGTALSGIAYVSTGSG